MAPAAQVRVRAADARVSKMVKAFNLVRALRGLPLGCTGDSGTKIRIFRSGYGIVFIRAHTFG